VVFGLLDEAIRDRLHGYWIRNIGKKR